MIFNWHFLDQRIVIIFLNLLPNGLLQVRLGSVVVVQRGEVVQTVRQNLPARSVEAIDDPRALEASDTILNVVGNHLRLT